MKTTNSLNLTVTLIISLILLLPLSVPCQILFIADLEVSNPRFMEPSGNRALDAKERGHIAFTLANRGKGTAEDVKISLVLLTDTAHLTYPQTTRIGSMVSGASKLVEVPVTAGFDVPDGKVTFRIVVSEKWGFEHDPLTLTFDTRALPKWWRLSLDSWTWQTAIPVALIFSLAVVAILRMGGRSVWGSAAIGFLILCFSYSLSVAYIHSWQFYERAITDFPPWWSLSVFALMMFGIISLSDGLIRAKHPSELLVVLLSYISVVLLCIFLLFAAIDVLLLMSLGICAYMVFRRDMTNGARTSAFLLLSTTLFYTLLHASMALSQTPSVTMFRNFIRLHSSTFLVVYVIVTLGLELYFLYMLRSAGASGSNRIHPLWLLGCALYNAAYMLPLALGYFDTRQLITFLLLSVFLGCTWIFGRQIVLYR